MCEAHVTAATTQVFFNRPGHPFGIDLLLDDIRHAQKRVDIATAWFTDTAVAAVFVASAARDSSQYTVVNAAYIKDEHEV